MREPSRRAFLHAVAVAAVGSGASGCLTTSLGTSPKSPPESESPTSDPTPADPDELTTWERSTSCDAMHDSAIKVDAVARSVDDDVVPIHFSSLTAGERDILGTVTTEGGYATCDRSDAFRRVVERVSETVDAQDGRMQVFLERDGRFYRLYVEQEDQVYAY